MELERDLKEGGDVQEMRWSASADRFWNVESQTVKRIRVESNLHSVQLERIDVPIGEFKVSSSM